MRLKRKKKEKKKRKRRETSAERTRWTDASRRHAPTAQVYRRGGDGDGVGGGARRLRLNLTGQAGGRRRVYANGASDR